MSAQSFTFLRTCKNLNKFSCVTFWAYNINLQMAIMHFPQHSALSLFATKWWRLSALLLLWQLENTARISSCLFLYHLHIDYLSIKYLPQWTIFKNTLNSTNRHRQCQQVICFVNIICCSSGSFKNVTLVFQIIGETT